MTVTEILIKYANAIVEAVFGFCQRIAEFKILGYICILGSLCFSLLAKGMSHIDKVFWD